MKEQLRPEAARRERALVLLSLAAAILCAVLAFRFAVPLKGTEEQSLPDGQTLSAYTRVDLNTADVMLCAPCPAWARAVPGPLWHTGSSMGRSRRWQMRQTFRA